MSTHARSRRALGALTALVLAVVVAGCANRVTGGTGAAESDPGITEDTILIGSSQPQSGAAAVFRLYGAGQQAYFKYVNEELGGIDGRKIKLQIHDDAAQPARTVENVKRLVERSKVFAIAFVFGSQNNLSNRDYLNSRKIPQLYGATGHPALGSAQNIDAYPWTIGWIPPYSVEAAADARYLKEHNPDAKVAILYQNDDLGTSLVEAFERSIEGSKIEVVAKESYNLSDPTVSSQVAVLSDAGADVFLNYSQGTVTAQAISTMARLGWDPTMFVPSFDTSLSVLKPAGLDNSKGAVAPVYLKNPSDPRWDDDEGMRRFKRIVREYGGSAADPTSPLVAFGYTQAELLAQALRAMEEPTRESLMSAVRSMSDVELSMLLPDITVTTSKNDGYPLETVRMQEFDGTSWRPIDDVYSFEGRASELLE